MEARVPPRATFGRPRDCHLLGHASLNLIETSHRRRGDHRGTPDLGGIALRPPLRALGDAGLFVHRGDRAGGVYTWGEPLSLLLLWTGWALGGICSYGIGRSFGRQVVTALTSGAALAYGDQASRNAPFGLVLLFPLGLPSEVPGYVLGLVRYDFAKYVLAAGLAELPYAVATVYLGASVLERRIPVLLGLGAAVTLFSTWAFYTLHKRLSAGQ